MLGPFLLPSDTPVALLGVGNRHTCRLDGFFFLVGMTAVPMYTLGICIYYVCKLKCRMTDAQITHRVERKIHATIIIVNLVLYLTALGLGVINPSITGSICLVSKYPTGCRQRPDIFGECDSRTSGFAFEFFYLLTGVILPVLCLFGIICSLAIIFWNVLLSEKRSRIEREDTMANATGVQTRTRRTRRNKYLRSNLYSDMSMSSRSDDDDDDDDEDKTGLQVEVPSRTSLADAPVAIDLEPHSDADASNFSANVSSVSGGEIGTNTKVDLEQDPGKNSNQERTELIDDRSKMSRKEDDDEEEVAPQESGSRVSFNDDAQTDNASTHQIAADQTRNDNNPVEMVSRLYKKELLIQLCLYVSVYCLCMLPYGIVQLMILARVPPSQNLLLAVATLFPLGGLFNIFVYTRPKVSAYRRTHPECSRLRALWLVLKAGGELPNANRNSTRCCLSCFGRRRRPLPTRRPIGRGIFRGRRLPSDEPESHSDGQTTGAEPPEAIDSSHQKYSAVGINGMSQSLSRDNVAHRSTDEWDHAAGIESGMGAILEGDGSDEEESLDELSSFDASNEPNATKADDKDDFWASTFQRVQQYNPSE